jgi:hypothetical protein
MPDQSGHSTSRDFAYQNAEESYAPPHPSGAPQIYSTQLQQRYEAEQAANARGGLATPDQAPVLGPSLRYMDFNAQQDPDAQQGASAQFPEYGFNTGAWDWNNSIDFPEFGNHYEPQGELVQELQNQNVSNDFSIPLPITNTDTVYQSPHPTPPVPPTPAQNPLSPPPKPPQKPSIQTGMKRKAGSEPNSAISQNASSLADPPQRPAKRPNKSRTSSDASATSPTVAVSTNTDARPPMTASSSAPAGIEAAPAPKADNEVAQKRREVSKGTGPQGRVIDVSKPRRVAESPGASDMLPAGKVFPIQIGSELFRLSGASLSSDGKHHPLLHLVGSPWLTMQEHRHTSLISLETKYTTTRVALVT